MTINLDIDQLYKELKDLYRDKKRKVEREINMNKKVIVSVATSLSLFAAPVTGHARTHKFTINKKNENRASMSNRWLISTILQSNKPDRKL